jgi:hypothetical protein
MVHLQGNKPTLDNIEKSFLGVKLVTIEDEMNN